MDFFDDDDFTLSDAELSQLREEVRTAAPEETEEAEFFPFSEDTFPCEEEPPAAEQEEENDPFDADDTQILDRRQTELRALPHDAPVPPAEEHAPTIEELAAAPVPSDKPSTQDTDIRRLESELSTARRELELMGWLMEQKDQLLEEVQASKRNAERQAEYVRMDAQRDRGRADDLSSQLVQVQVYLSQPWWRRISKPVLKLTDS
jgi:hypothetical protein